MRYFEHCYLLLGYLIQWSRSSEPIQSHHNLPRYTQSSQSQPSTKEHVTRPLLADGVQELERVGLVVDEAGELEGGVGGRQHHHALRRLKSSAPRSYQTSSERLEKSVVRVTRLVSVSSTQNFVQSMKGLLLSVSKTLFPLMALILGTRRRCTRDTRGTRDHAAGPHVGQRREHPSAGPPGSAGWSGTAGCSGMTKPPETQGRTRPVQRQSADGRLPRTRPASSALPAPAARYRLG